MNNLLFFKYGLCTIILTMLMATSAIEYVIVKKNPGKYDNAQDKGMDYKLREIFYRSACTWSLRGMIISILIAGIYDHIPQLTLIGNWSLSIPFSFILVWTYYYSLGSVSVDFINSVKDYYVDLDRTILSTIFEYSLQKKTIEFSLVETAVLTDFPYPVINNVTQKLLQKISLISPGVRKINALWADLELTPTLLKGHIIKLCDDHYLSHNNYDDYFLVEEEYDRWKRQQGDQVQ